MPSSSVVSPTVLQSGPYRLFFFSSDRDEPVHIHIERDAKAAKYWLRPISLAYNHGFSASELNKVADLIRQHESQLAQAWHEYFESGD
jgi:hypothetical protein